MLLLKILILVFSFIQIVQPNVLPSKGKAQIASKIVGGTAQSISAVPFVLILKRNGRFICGASLLGPRKAITAAHCTVTKATYSVTGGTSDLYSGGTTVQVSTVVNYPKYNSNTNDGDLSILKLATDMPTNANIKPIQLLSSSTTVSAGATVSVSGFGTTSSGGSISSKLLTVNLQIVSSTDCKKKYFLTDNMVCAAAPGKDSCQGDSGGALTFGGKLYGIVSFGEGCALAGYPGVYTKIANYASFINTA